MSRTVQTPFLVPLRQTTLSAVGDRVSVPSFRREVLSGGVVHLGVGNFHRAHQAMYFDQLADLGLTTWGLTGVGLRNPTLKDALSVQDNLFTVVQQDGARSMARVVGSMVDYFYAPSESSRVLTALTSRRTRLVTLTLTGDGYPFGCAGELRNPDQDVRHDLHHPHSPRTAWGYLLEALGRRRASGGRPFTVLSCDNLPDSGGVTRANVLGFADRRDHQLSRWISEHVSFPNALVDRITPATTCSQRSMVRDTFGIDDRSPVTTEAFSEWIVEDSFCHERPPLEEVGVQFVVDVAPYKLRKTRLLNGSHCAVGYLGTLAGYRTTSEALADPTIKEAMAQLMAREVSPLLPELPGADLAAYRTALLERFSNRQISDPLSRLCRRGSTKMPSYLLPSLHEALDRQSPHGLLTLAVAAWMRYLRGTDLQGRAVVVEDAHGRLLQRLAVDGGDDPRPLLSQTGIFGELRSNPGFVESLRVALTRLGRDGLPAALRAAGADAFAHRPARELAGSSVG